MQYLHTLVVSNPEKAKKLTESIPPGMCRALRWLLIAIVFSSFPSFCCSRPQDPTRKEEQGLNFVLLMYDLSYPTLDFSLLIAYSCFGGIYLDSTINGLKTMRDHGNTFLRPKTINTHK